MSLSRRAWDAWIENAVAQSDPRDRAGQVLYHLLLGLATARGFGAIVRVADKNEAAGAADAARARPRVFLG